MKKVAAQCHVSYSLSSSRNNLGGVFRAVVYRGDLGGY